MIRCLSLLGAFLTTALASPAGAEVLDSAPGQYRLRQEGFSEMPREQLWERLLEPAEWWSPAHTYSGDSGNLSLDASVGGYWKEAWEGGVVAHGRVILLQAPQTLRLEAPFGPLQGVGAYTVWTISLEPEQGGTRVLFEETAVAPASAKLDALAPAVDAVKTEAMRRLVRREDGQ